MFLMEICAIHTTNTFSKESVRYTYVLMCLGTAYTCDKLNCDRYRDRAKFFQILHETLLKDDDKLESTSDSEVQSYNRFS